MVGLYVAVFGQLTWAQHANFATFGFDMGIYDQGIWLLSRFEDPFVTVRGLHYFGHHLNLVTVLFVPAYWLGAGPIFLYLVETVALAAGAIPLWLLARDRWRHEGWALVAAGAYLLYPSVGWINWWHFHPDALIITPLLFAWWLAVRQRWGWYWVAVALALAAKEDAAMAIAVLGVVVAMGHDRRRGLLTLGTAAGWFLLATRVIIPLLTDGRGPFYDDFFSDFGTGSTFTIAGRMATNPGQVLELLSDGERLDYYWHMLAPVGLLALAGPWALLVGIPQALVNALSSHAHLHDFQFHYSSVVTAAVFLATVEGIGWLSRGRRRAVATLSAVLAVSSVAAHVWWSPSPAGREFDSGVWARTAAAEHEAVREGLALVPDDAGVSAIYYLVPQLTHREHIYEWPNPFVPTYWGVEGEDAPPPTVVDYLVLDTRLLGESAPLLERLLTADYETLFDHGPVLVARRTTEPAR